MRQDESASNLNCRDSYRLLLSEFQFGKTTKTLCRTPVDPYTHDHWDHTFVPNILLENLEMDDPHLKPGFK
jgi:hypothetical protein